MIRPLISEELKILLYNCHNSYYVHFRVIGMGVQPTVVSETLYSFSRDFGQRGTYIEVSFCCCSVFPTAQAISGIDVALWDLLGHLLKVPVCHLLGGSFRSIDVKAPNI